MSATRYILFIVVILPLSGGEPPGSLGAPPTEDRSLLAASSLL
ncbi:MAG: hypothetical protein O2956_00545 [Gemmatimonadetes bacterium]|nr:hypothetical protein [Gemmatimonadota bacterium]